jgi:hypothetical protein
MVKNLGMGKISGTGGKCPLSLKKTRDERTKGAFTTFHVWATGSFSSSDIVYSVKPEIAPIIDFSRHSKI